MKASEQITWLVNPSRLLDSKPVRRMSSRSTPTVVPAAHVRRVPTRAATMRADADLEGRADDCPDGYTPAPAVPGDPFCCVPLDAPSDSGDVSAPSDSADAQPVPDAATDAVRQDADGSCGLPG